MVSESINQGYNNLSKHAFTTNEAGHIRMLAKAKQIWFSITEPSPQTIIPEDRHKQRFINTITWIFAPIAIGLIVVDSFNPDSPNLFSNTDALTIILAILVLFSLIYYFSRQGAYHFVLPVIIICGTGVIAVNASVASPPHLEIIYLSLIVILASNLYRPFITVLTGIGLIGVLTIFHRLVGTMPLQTYIDIVAFLAVVTVLMLVINYQRDLLENDRRAILLQERTRLQIILDNLPVYIWTMDEAYQVTSLNSKNNVDIEAALRDYLTSADGIAYIRSDYQAEKQFEFQLNDIPFNAKMESIQHTDQTTYIGVAFDVSERKQNETFLRQQVRQEEQRKILSDFLSNASHDLRTPLTILRTSSHLLERLTDPERRQKQIDKLNRTIDRLDSTIDSMFALLRLNMNATPSLLPAQINTIVENIITNHVTTANSRDIRIERDLDATLPESLIAEEELIFGISEILKNALQYSDDDSTVSIQTAQDETHIIIKVQDEGIGIPEQHLGDIFQPFYRVAEHRSTEEQQIGMGLAIAQRIVERHGGTIDVESTLGVGTTFTIRIPLREQ